MSRSLRGVTGAGVGVLVAASLLYLGALGVRISEATTGAHRVNLALARSIDFDQVVAEVKIEYPRATVLRCSDGQFNEVYLALPTPWPHLGGTKVQVSEVSGLSPGFLTLI